MAEAEQDGLPGESRLARWSRRKAAQQRESHSEKAGADDDRIVDDSAEAQADGEPPEAAPSPPALTDADMPPLSSLTSESDFSGFLSPGVSEELRKLALRKLFSLPSFQVRDGLDDYDDDFTVFEPLGDTPTNDPWSARQRRLAEEREAAERERAHAAAEDASPEESAPESAGDGEPAKTPEGPDEPDRTDAAERPSAEPASDDESAARQDDNDDESAT